MDRWMNEGPRVQCTARDTNEYLAFLLDLLIKIGYSKTNDRIFNVVVSVNPQPDSISDLVLDAFDFIRKMKSAPVFELNFLEQK